MNWAVLLPIIGYLGLMLGLGIWAMRRQSAVDSGDKTLGYFLGGRSLGWFVLVLTMLASAASAGTFVGGPGLVYGQGYGWVLVSIWQVPTAFVAFTLLGKRFAILSRKLNLITLTDFFRQRYESNAVVILLSLGLVGLLIAYMVPQFVAGARLLQAVTGADYEVLLITFAAVIMIYIAVGGFLASALTDAAQGIIMFFGGIALWVLLLGAAGGLGDVNAAVMETSPESFALPGPGGFTVPMIASYSLQLGLLFCALPHLAVRAMSYSSSRAVHIAMQVGPIVMWVITLGFLTMGIVAAFFVPGLEVGDLALPMAIVGELPDGVAGILLAAPIAAAMSTIDSMILVVAGALVRDLYMNYVKPDVSDRSASRLGSICSVVIGAVVVWIAFHPPNYLEYLVIYAIGGLEVVLFLPLVAGLYWKRGNALGVVLGSVSGFTWYVLANDFYPDLALGMFPIATSAAVAAAGYLLGAYLGPRPRRAVLVKFWGTQAEIDRLAPEEAMVGKAP
jgi:sodium/pantothenate symporter